MKVWYLQVLLNIVYQSFIAIALKTLIFTIFGGLEIGFVTKKLHNIFLGLSIYFSQKLVSLWTSYDMLCHLVHIIFFLICIT